VSANDEPQGGGRPGEAEYLRELAATPVAQIVAELISTLVPVAYLRLGAVPEHPEAVELAEARVAIDAIAGLVASVERQLPPPSLQEVQNLLTSLRMAYVQVARSQGVEPGEVPGAPRGQAEAPPPPPPPARPKIWTPRGDV
jgi:hypothetical protein